MYLSHLSLTNFRNFARLDIDVPGGPILLVGGNAEGKTSLLESVYYLATFVSFHASHDRELVNFMAGREPLAVARIVADFQRTDGPTQVGRRLEVRLIQERNGYAGAPRMRKEILLDGVKKKVGDVVGTFNAVLFLPHMLRVVEGSPEDRRRYLNLTIGQVIPSYVSDLSAYNRTISQRNALLKQLAERGGDPAQLAYWDEQLSELGARVMYARIHAIQELERLARRKHSELTRGKETLRLAYLPGYDPLPQPPLQYALPMDAPADRSRISLEQIRTGFLDCLTSLHHEEIQRGMTTVGPHRDEFRFLSSGIDLGTYGSRGQGRTAVLSLKMAEVDWMKAKTGQWPVLLLDEVLAELDPARRSDLLTTLLSSEQALLSTTDLDLFNQDFVGHARIWAVAGGRVSEDSEITSGLS